VRTVGSTFWATQSGNLSPEKGLRVVAACAEDAARRHLPLTFRVLGSTTEPIPQAPDVPLSIFGQYEDSGLAQLLAGDAADFEKTGSETARLVRLAVDAGHQAAHVKAKYTPVQWERVRLAPVAAAYVVMMADKSRPVGAMDEMRAANGAIDDAKKVASPTSVLSLAFDTDFSVEELSKFARGRTNADALRTVREAIEVVTRNSPGDVSTYRRLVADVASQVASASREGGVLRFGGTHASASERAALDQLRSVIGDRHGR